ncbi:MAG: hypothetical protein OXC72_13200 [Roseovarius sp.]|nr:hypothetical protein [Roseovarius sp.]
MPFPKRINASFNDVIFDGKPPLYLKRNAPARSLHEELHGKNPGLLQAISNHGLPLQARNGLTESDFDKRSRFYRQLAAPIWSPKRPCNAGRTIQV